MPPRTPYPRRFLPTPLPAAMLILIPGVFFARLWYDSADKLPATVLFGIVVIVAAVVIGMPG